MGNNYDKETSEEFTFIQFIKSDIIGNWSIPSIEKPCYENDKCLLTKIYPIETLTSDVLNNDIYKHTGIKNYVVGKIPHKNKTKKVDYRDYYTEQWMIDKVREKYKKDIEIGNYEF